ncbi:MAG: histone deacetylase [Acidobacteriota bacterium]
MNQKNKFHTGYVFDEIYKDHILFQGHPESPQRLNAIEKRLKETGLSDEIKHLSPQKNPLDFIRKIHTNDHISQIKSIPNTGLIASKAVSGVLEGVDSVCRGEVKNAFCAVRPPGHHAQNSGQEEGFCFYNNIAVAARYIQQKYHYKNILIIDWDYHHGNATEWAFYDDPSILFFSTHDWHAYPGTGDPSRIGTGDGKGYNINAHLSPGSGDEVIKKAWDDKLIPASDHFNPDFILISAGFDSRIDDLLGCFTITDKGFFDLTQNALQIARTYCDGRLLSILEGGYNLTGLAQAVCSHIEALLEN